MTEKDITPYNDEGNAHGYWEYYWHGDTIWYKCFYVNGDEVGYEEYYYNILKPFNVILNFHL